MKNRKSKSETIEGYRARLEGRFLTNGVSDEKRTERRIVINMGCQLALWILDDFTTKLEAQVRENRRKLGVIVVIATTLFSIILPYIIGKLGF